MANCSSKGRPKRIFFCCLFRISSAVLSVFVHTATYLGATGPNIDIYTCTLVCFFRRIRSSSFT